MLPYEQFLLFSQYFNISLTSGVKLDIHLLNVIVRFIFIKFCKSDMLRYGYLEVFSENPLNFEITRVDCSIDIKHHRLHNYKKVLSSKIFYGYLGNQSTIHCTVAKITLIYIKQFQSHLYGINIGSDSLIAFRDSTLYLHASTYSR